jgi:phage/plasmid-associated DNA primase
MTLQTCLGAAGRPAVVRWFLEGAVGLLRERDYTIPASHHEALVTWRRSADPVALFVDERTKPPKDDEWVSASLLYEAFRTWCDRNGHRLMSSTKFAMRLAALGIEGTRTEHGKRYRTTLTDEFLTGSHGMPSANSRGRSHGCN